MPKVSVVMPVYNAGPYLREALDSLLAQTCGGFDIWAIDDGSTDDSPAVLASYSDSRLHVHRQANTGQTGALNTGLRLATGEYIARMDQDDVAEPERLAQQAEFLDAHPEVGLVGSDYVEIDERGAVLREMRGFTTDRDLRLQMGKRNPFAHSSVMFRHSLIQTWGPYVEDSRYRQFQDYELWIRLAAHTQIASLPLVLMRRRVHGHSSSARADDARLRCEIDMRANAIRTLRLPPWFWLYVLMPAIALRLPLTWRNSLRRLLDRPTA
jgi:glycosyltransferase involved in cell wall biosynthesis